MKSLLTVPMTLAISASMAMAQAPGAPVTPAKPTEQGNELGYRVFDKGEVGEIPVNFECYLDVEDPDPLNREACDALMQNYGNDPSPEIQGGADISVHSTFLKSKKLRTDGSIQTENGTIYMPDYSKMSLGNSGLPKSDNTTQTERVTSKSSFMVTVQKMVGKADSGLRKFWNGLNPDPQFFGTFAEHTGGHTAPFMAAAIQFRKEFKLRYFTKMGVKKVSATVLVNPFNVLAIPQIRSVVKRSDEFADQIKEGAIHHISAATGIPADRVEALVPHKTIEAAIAQGTALATAELNKRVSYANGLRTMVQEAYATFHFTENVDAEGKVLDGKSNWTARIGKISPNQQRSLLASSTNLMFASSYQASVRMSRTTYAVTATISSMLGPQESPLGGLVEGYIRAMIKQGADYFSVRPNAVDVNFELKENWFEERGIPVLTGAMAGFGAVSGRPFGYLRVDGSQGPVSGSYMAYWQACQSGSATWTGCQEHRSVQKRQYGTVLVEVGHMKNKFAQFLSSKIFAEVKGEFYKVKGSATQNGAEDFTMRAVSVGRPLSPWMQKPFGKIGAQAAFEFRVARVSVDGAHGHHGSNHNIYGVGLVFTKKPKNDHH